jgi:uncharacterized protein YndB with AHSA1/START domain
MDNERTVMIERVFNAPRERMWRAWIDPAQLAQWWGPKDVTTPECRVDARVGGEIYAVMLAGPELGPLAGQRWPMKGVFKEVIENEKLVFANNAVAEDGTILIEGETTVFLEDVGSGKTKMTLTARGVGKAPQAPQMLAGMQQGWAESIEKLSTLVT